LLIVFAANYVRLGTALENIRMVLRSRADWGHPLRDEDRKSIAVHLEDAKIRCQELELEVSLGVVEHWHEIFSKNLPETSTEAICAIDEIKRVVNRELQGVAFYDIGRARRNELIQMYDALTEKVTTPWPVAWANLNDAKICYGMELGTACVFHCMRAAEKILTTLAVSLGRNPTRENWQNIIEAIESDIRDLDNLQKGADREKKQTFYSQAAMQFRYIKNAWRNHVMHGRMSYDPKQAHDIWQHVCDMLGSVCTELEELIES
jgi:hypothetical protein